jgi:hypothetical protein
MVGRACCSLEVSPAGQRWKRMRAFRGTDTVTGRFRPRAVAVLVAGGYSADLVTTVGTGSDAAFGAGSRWKQRQGPEDGSVDCAVRSDQWQQFMCSIKSR